MGKRSLGEGRRFSSYVDYPKYSADLQDPWADVSVENELDLYLRQMSQHPLLSAEEEISLAKAIEAGKQAKEQLADQTSTLSADEKHELVSLIEQGISARCKLIQSNTRLVVSIAKKYRGRGLSFLDLIQEGNIGLMAAVRKFDYRMDNRFSTYATWWIRQSVSRAITNFGRTIRIPSHMYGHLTKLKHVQHTLEQELGRKPSIEEIADQLDLPPAQVGRLLRTSVQPLSLEMRLGEDDSSDLTDIIADEGAPIPAQVLSDKMLKGEMAALLETLTVREARILHLRYGLNETRPHTLKEIGRIFGLSRERVRQVERSALHKLRSPIKGRDLLHYLTE